MANSMTEELKRPLPLTLLVLAVVGWIFAIAFWISSASQENEYTTRIEELETSQAGLQATIDEQRATAGTVEELQAQIVLLEAAEAELSERRDAAEASTTQLEQQLAAAQEQLDLRRQALAEIDQQAQATGERLARQNEQIATLEDRIAERSQELAAVGERLEAARRQEAETRETIAALSDRASSLAGEAADAEKGMQQARQDQAAAEQQVQAIRQEVQALANQRAELEQNAERLAERRVALAEDVAAAEELRASVQAQAAEITQTLTERTEDLARIEQRIAEVQAENVDALPPEVAGEAARSEAGQPPGGGQLQAGEQQAAGQDRTARGDGGGIEVGRYAAGPLQASFGPDGAFRMEAEGRGAVEGRYTVAEGVLTLTGASGDIRGARFPMQCRVVQTQTGFRLAADGQSCRELDGTEFQRQG